MRKMDPEAAERMLEAESAARKAVQDAFYAGYEAGRAAGYDEGFDDGFFEHRADMAHDTEDEREIGGWKW